MQLQYKIDDTIQIDDKKYIVNASFDTILRLIDLLEDKRLPTNIRIRTGLIALIGTDLGLKYSIEDKSKILKQILEEYVKMESKKVYDLLGNELPESENDEQLIDYNIDAKYIYAAFMQVYGIDLIEQQGKLHWSKFNALLEGLPEGTVLGQIMSYRSWSEENDKKDHKQVMRELKRKWTLGGESIDGWI